MKALLREIRATPGAARQQLLGGRRRRSRRSGARRPRRHSRASAACPPRRFNGELLARRSSSGRDRLALEVEDHDVALGDDHLAQMVVAVQAGLDQARPAAPSSAGERRLDRRPRGECRLDVGAACPAGAGCAAPSRMREAVLDLRLALAPARPPGPPRLDRLAGEGRVVGVDREGAVQLGRAAAEQAGHGEVELVDLGRRRPARLRRSPQLLERPVEIVEGPAPSRRPGWRRSRTPPRGRRRAVGPAALDRAQERRRAGEAGDVGQEAADLQLRVDAGLEPPVDLDASTCSSTSSELLLCSAPRRRTGASSGSASSSRSAAVPAADHGSSRPADRRPSRIAARSVARRNRRRGWRRRARRPAGPRRALGERVGQQGAARRQMLLAPGDCERQQVALGHAAGERHLELGQEVGRMLAAQLSAWPRGARSRWRGPWPRTSAAWAGTRAAPAARDRGRRGSR